MNQDAMATLMSIAQRGADAALSDDIATADKLIQRALGWADCVRLTTDDLEIHRASIRAWMWIWAATQYAAGAATPFTKAEKWLMWGDAR